MEQKKVATELREFAELVKRMIRLEVLGKDVSELRREVYMLSHRYSREMPGQGS